MGRISSRVAMFLAAAGMTLLCAEASAQWKKGYKQNDWQVGYGFKSCVAVVDALGDVEMGDVTRSNVETANRESIGSVTAQFTHRRGRLVSFGVALSYEQTRQDCVALLSGQGKCKVGELTCRYVSLTPLLRFNWFERGMVCLYSKAAIGLTFIGDSFDDTARLGYDVRSAKSRYVGYQASPLGLMVGRRLCGFVEAGFGTHGLAQAGVAYRF